MNEKLVYDNFGFTTELLYGNDKTGDMSMWFLNGNLSGEDGCHRIGSESYNRRYNQFIGWVNGK